MGEISNAGREPGSNTICLDGNVDKHTRKGGGYRIGECHTLDEKMGQTYIHYETANTLAARDYKQPQAVVYGTESRPLRTNLGE